MQFLSNNNIQKNNKIFWLTLFILFCCFVYALRSVLLPFVAGIIIGYLLDPLATKVEKFGINRTLSTFLVMFLVIIIVVPLSLIIINMFNEQLSVFINAAPHYVSVLIKKSNPILEELRKYFPDLNIERVKEEISANASNNLKIIGSITKKVISSGVALVNVFSLIIITPIVAFYMLRDWKEFVAEVNNLLPIKSKASINIQAREIDKTLAGFLRGQISVCIILGSFYALGLHIIGLELGILIGFIAGLISFIPYVGSITGFIISVLLGIVQFSTLTPVMWIIGVFSLGQFLEGNFLTPKLVGGNVGLHPVWVMFALLAGGVLLGFLGLLIAVPFAAIIGVLIRHAIDNYKKSDIYLEG